jgi:hypothetical protein
VPPLPRLSGRVVGFENKTVSGPLEAPQYVELVQPAASIKQAMNLEKADRPVFSTAIANDGSFEFRDVTPGDYTIRVGPSKIITRSFPSFAAMAPATVRIGERDVKGVTLSLVKEAPINGFVAVDENGPVPPFTLSFVHAFGINSSKPPLRRLFSGAGPFQLELPKGEYRIDVSGLPSGYIVKSLGWCGGQDVLRGVLYVDTPPACGLMVNLGVSKAPPWTRVRGRVVGERPNEAARIVLATEGAGPYQEFETVLEPDGSFIFERLLPGRYNVMFEPVPQGLGGVALVVPEDGLSDIKIDLPARTRVSGRVTAEHGAVLPAMTLSMVGAGSRTTRGLVEILPVSREVRVTEDGTFSTVLPEGEYRIVVDVDEPYGIRAINQQSVNLVSETLKVGKAEIKDVGVTLSVPVFAVKGRVYSSAATASINQRVALSGAPLLETQYANVGTDGAYEFPNVPSGYYDVWVLPEGPAAPVSVDNKDVSGVDFGMLAGRVVLSDTALQLPLEFSFFATASSFKVSASVRPDGTFETILPAGEYRVRPAGILYGYSLRSFGSNISDPSKETFRFSPPNSEEVQATIGLLNPVRISGRVIGSENANPGTPLTVMLVRIGFDQRFEAPVGADGSFEFARVPSSYYQISVSEQAAITLATMIDAERDVSQIEIRIPRQITIRGRVLVEGATTPDLSSMTVASKGEGLSKGGLVGPDGTFSFSSMATEQMISVRSLPPGYDVKTITSGSMDLGSSYITPSGPLEILIVLIKR